MTDEDKKQLLQGMFNGAQLTNVQVIGVVESGAKVVYKEVHGTEDGGRTPTDEEVARVIPEALSSAEANRLLAKAVEAGWLDEHWQPTVSSTEAALLAMRMAESLGIKTVWKVFGALWHRNSASLRAKYNVAMEQEKSRAFLGELRKRLR